MPRISRNKCKCHTAERFPETRKLSEACGELLPVPASPQATKGHGPVGGQIHHVWLESSRVNDVFVVTQLTNGCAV